MLFGASLLLILLTRNGHLPRQARDTHKEKLSKGSGFSQELALTDDYHYVRGLSALALERIGAENAALLLLFPFFP